MVKRYNVSVSDELAERIYSWKDKISPSAVFQRAMEKAIDSEERYQNQVKGGTDMSAIIERLMAEKKEAEDVYRELGRTEGVDWAKNARYKDLRTALGLGKDFADVRRQVGAIPEEWLIKADLLDGYVDEIFKEDPVLDQREKRGGISMLSNEAEDWLAGWFDGVQDFWSEVENKL